MLGANYTATCACVPACIASHPDSLRRMSGLEMVLGLVMLVGLVGVVVPVFPGLVLIAGAGLLWAIDLGGPGAWAVFFQVEDAE